MDVIHIRTDGKYEKVRISARGVRPFERAVAPMLGRADAFPAPEYMMTLGSETGESGSKRDLVMVVDDLP